jgi:hypothetical protein
MKFKWQAVIGPWICEINYDQAGLHVDTQSAEPVED